MMRKQWSEIGDRTEWNKGEQWRLELDIRVEIRIGENSGVENREHGWELHMRERKGDGEREWEREGESYITMESENENLNRR